MRTQQNKTYSAKPGEVENRWLLIDAKGQAVGRLAADVAALLRGKHKTDFTPHVDTGDHVVVTNAAHLVLTGNKADRTMRHRHSGYPGGLKSEPYGALFQSDPARAFRAAVRGMLPHTSLGRKMLRKLKVYAEADHPHQAQQPVPYEPPHATKK
ncbi:MAG: 50S ribosomal protein L13 [Armatimonadota bacterium]|nr:MAG: 50S ribosomal protein L13 [Armatimonadota bacterium]